MTPKEAAKQLIDTFHGMPISYDMAKNCARLVADKIINIPFDIRDDASERCIMPHIDFYISVKEEIEKL